MQDRWKKRKCRNMPRFFCTKLFSHMHGMCWQTFKIVFLWEWHQLPNHQVLLIPSPKYFLNSSIHLHLHGRHLVLGCHFCPLGMIAKVSLVLLPFCPSHCLTSPLKPSFCISEMDIATVLPSRNFVALCRMMQGGLTNTEA